MNTEALTKLQAGRLSRLPRGRFAGRKFNFIHEDDESFFVSTDLDPSDGRTLTVDKTAAGTADQAVEVARLILMHINQVYEIGKQDGRAELARELRGLIGAPSVEREGD